MADRIGNHDWTDSSLGPLEHWPDTLKTTLALCLASRFPQAVLWGPDLLTFHNDAFATILGDKPSALGRPFSQVWEEAWSDISDMARRTLQGEAFYTEDFPLVIDRSGSPERAYFTFCYSPIRDHEGHVVGLLDTVTETTATVLANQRLHFLDTLGRAVASATDPALIMATTTRMLGEQLNLSSCGYGMMDADQDCFSIDGDWVADDAPRLIGHYHLSRFGSLAVSRLRAGAPLVINALDELPLADAASYQQLGIHASVCMPLFKDGRLIALMAVNDRAPRVWSVYEQALIREVTERCWAHIQRVQSFAEARAAATALAALNATLEQRVGERTTQLQHAEAALRQSQKLEAIGQLTGGVAHDFNNLLTIIRSSIHFLKRPDLEEGRRARYIKTMADSVDRGAKLTGQLLAFARRQALVPETFAAAPRLAAIADMLDTAIGARLQIELELPDRPCHIHADLAQLETAIVNLVLNARDAMGGEGVLRLCLQPDHAVPSAPGQPPMQGRFAAISVIDTGTGIAPELIERIFDPFFTTKASGQGTGLGLSQVFGFAKQSGGEVQVRSEPGQSTTFTLYLPQVTSPERSAQVPVADVQRSSREAARSHVLVVEDNLDIGSFAEQILQDHGYRVSWARNGEEALDLLDNHDAGVSAVFSDVMMPGMNGLALAKAIRQRHPPLPVILTSGYSDVIAERGVQGFPFIAKPYSAEQVCALLDKLLAQVDA
ncbi:ATP-binding protein [Pseudomonas entomophila]|uniref:GAF domain-containing hybrid sensor histidine kinase/response regulator n=1 Tax=Pseudomonas entomophila TaxID=312306 RepID=UPI003EBE31F8